MRTDLWWFVNDWMREMRVPWCLWCNQTLPQGGMWENCYSYSGDEKWERSDSMKNGKGKRDLWEEWTNLKKQIQACWWRGPVKLNENDEEMEMCVVEWRQFCERWEEGVRERGEKVWRKIKNEGRRGLNMTRVVEIQKVCEVIKKPWRKVCKRVDIKNFEEKMDNEEDSGWRRW